MQIFKDEIEISIKLLTTSNSTFSLWIL